jgi:DNA (cytosine-5)-methyltransferase 1
MRTLTSAGHQSLLVHPVLVGGNRHGNHARPADTEPMPTLTTAHGGGAYALVYPYRRSNDMKPTDQPLDSVTTVDPFGLVVPLSRSGDPTKHATSTDRPLPTETARRDLALAAPNMDVSMDARDWGFRMLDPAELGRGMAFPDSYQVHGNKRDRTRQYGNAVTPPVSQVLDTRVLDALEHA